jgi:hypothetical protein
MVFLPSFHDLEFPRPLAKSGAIPLLVKVSKFSILLYCAFLLILHHIQSAEFCEIVVSPN